MFNLIIHQVQVCIEILLHYRTREGKRSFYYLNNAFEMWDLALKVVSLTYCSLINRGREERRKWKVFLPRSASDTEVSRQTSNEFHFNCL